VIYLNPEIKSGLGEDTFWTWFAREFPSSSFDVPDHLDDCDIVLRYSTLGHLPIPGKQVALCWELYPAMRDRFCSSEWDAKIAKVHECAAGATYRTVASNLSVAEYAQHGSVDIIPIGVDTDLFRPLSDKAALRAKHHLPLDREIGVWVGTAHPMKGYALLQAYATEHPDVHWVTICKTQVESVTMPGATAFVHAPQEVICELMGAGDFFLSTSLLRPYFMAEWEAMACDIPMRLIGDAGKEFVPSAHPRDDVLSRGWSRHAVKTRWEEYLTERGVTW
jgi:glycosyltransferase involved in cell wall biosynthesis